MSGNGSDRELEFFKIIAEERRLEIGNFWTRSLFYWGFITASAVAYFQARGLASRVPLIESVVAHFGLFCSSCWFAVNRGSKFWQENWEHKVERYEADWNLYRPVAPVQRKFLGAGKYSVTRITILLSLVTTLLWLVPIVATYETFGIRLSTALCSVADVIALAALFLGCKSVLPKGRS